MTTPIDAIGATTFAAPRAAAIGSPSGSTATTGTGSATTTGTTSGTASSTTNSLLDPQAFLQLLVAQLKYQDPSNPVDTSSFMNQTAMLSQVQTMNSMSSTLSSLVSAQQAQAATGLLGKSITYLDANGMRATGVVSAANLLAGGATLQVGNLTVPLSSVIGVSDPAAPSTTP